MKKIIPFIMAVFMAIPLLAQQTVVLGDVDDAVPGQIIEVPLFMYDFDNVGAISLQIGFDGNLLGWSEFIPNIPGIPAPDVGVLDNLVLLNWASAIGTDIDDKFGTLTFQYKGFFSGTLEFVEKNCEILDTELGVYTITYTGASVVQDPNLVPDGNATIGDASAIAGGTVQVPVGITDLDGFNNVAKALDFRVGYNNTKLTFAGLESVHSGFEVDEITAGGDLIITNYNLPDGFDFDGSTLFNLEFQYWGGGDAAVEFLPGSVITDGFANILVTEFGSGVVEQQFVADHGLLTIAKYVSNGAVTSTIDSLIVIPDPVKLTLTAEGLSDIYDMGLVHLAIAYDAEKLQFTGPLSASGWTINHGTPGLLILEKSNINGFKVNDGVLFTLDFDYLYVKVENPPNPQAYYANSLAIVEFEVGTYLLKTDGTPVGPGLNDGWVSMVMPGDVNCNGVVNLQDILILINHIYTPNDDLPCEAGYIAADVNGDGNITLADLLLLINIVYPPTP